MAMVPRRRWQTGTSDMALTCILRPELARVLLVWADTGAVAAANEVSITAAETKRRPIIDYVPP